MFPQNDRPRSQPLIARRRQPTAYKLQCFCAVISAFIFVGCSQNMDDQPRYEAYEASALFPDGKSARHLPAGTVPRSSSAGTETGQADFLTGRNEQGEPLKTLPDALNDLPLQEVVARGRDRYDIRCAPCHGLTGTGNGMVPRRGYPLPPSLYAERFTTAPVGELFRAIALGHPQMPNYEHQIPARERWQIATYVRALQFRTAVSDDQLSAADRAMLDGKPASSSHQPREEAP